MPILDPTNVLPGQIRGKYPKGDLPNLTQEQLEFGLVPDKDQIKPGDLLLTRSIQKKGLSSSAIREAQHAQYSDRTSWTHAAIYAQDWRVIEATPAKNVSSVNIIGWLPHTKILVRRPKAFENMQDSDALLYGMSIALEAAMFQGVAAYSMKSALGIFRRVTGTMKSVFVDHDETDTRSIVCSGLYAKCYGIARQVSLLTPDMQRQNTPVTPALLANVSSLYDVDVGWMQLI